MGALSSVSTPAWALVLMGVSGSGKTRVGEALAARLGVTFRDADSFHPKENVAKMSAGIPLTDADRWPWLDAIGAAIRATPADQTVVVSCSALRRIHRERIESRAVRPVTFVFLDGTIETIRRRMSARKHHFMPISLLESQFALLEPPGPDEPAVRVGVEQPVDEIAAEVLRRLGGHEARPRQGTESPT